MHYYPSSCGIVRGVEFSKSVVCKHYEDGGLNMRDAFTFLVSVKITWLQRIAEEFSYSELVMDIYPDLSTLRNYGGEYANIQMLRIENPF